MAKAHVLTTDLSSADEYIVDIVFPTEGTIVVEFDENLVYQAQEILRANRDFVSIKVRCEAEYPENEGKMRYEAIIVHRGGLSFYTVNDFTGDSMSTDIEPL